MFLSVLRQSTVIALDYVLRYATGHIILKTNISLLMILLDAVNMSLPLYSKVQHSHVVEPLAYKTDRIKYDASCIFEHE